MPRASLTQAIHSYQLKQQQWFSLLGITSADLVMAVFALLALLIFLCSG